MATPADLELLTGPGAADLLHTAVGAAGGELVSWAPRQVDHRPGSSTTVSYRVRVRWSDGVRTETLAARTGVHRTPDAPGVVRMAEGDREVAVWRFPLDPALPGLAAACDVGVLTALLASFGIEGVQPGELELQTLSYRPGRRAVIRVATRSGVLVIKAVRPSKVADLHARHRLLHAAGLPVPASLGWTDDGLLIMPMLPGASLRDVLHARDASSTTVNDLPSGEQVVALLDRLPADAVALPRRAAWSEHAAHYAGIVGSALPSQRDRAAELAAQVLEVVRSGPPRAEPTHGDLYETQLLVRGRAITGLLDVDTVGPGSRSDDLACALAHLSVLTLMWSGAAPAVRQLGARWLTTFERTVDPHDLRHRVAGVLLSLATGPHRVQETGWQLATVRRLDLVEHWLTTAAHNHGHPSSPARVARART